MTIIKKIMLLSIIMTNIGIRASEPLQVLVAITALASSIYTFKKCQQAFAIMIDDDAPLPFDESLGDKGRFAIGGLSLSIGGKIAPTQKQRLEEIQDRKRKGQNIDALELRYVLQRCGPTIGLAAFTGWLWIIALDSFRVGFSSCITQQ